MSAYYNEFDPYAAQWLRNLIAAGHIAPGDVDSRSILEVSADDLRRYKQAHFFAGIGGWSLAARLAGWPDDRPLWTGSCPCQPFSVAGKGEGQADERHLWPAFFELIRARRPDVVMGEQVAAAVGKDWLDGVSLDLESIGYTCGAAVVPACAVDAPHRRDRLWFVADDSHKRIDGARSAGQGWRVEHSDGSRAISLADASGGRCGGPGEGQGELSRGAETVGASDGAMADAEHSRFGGRQSGCKSQDRPGAALPPGEGHVANAHEKRQPGCQKFDVHPAGEQQTPRGRDADRCGMVHGRNSTAWAGASWIAGADGKARRVEPSIRLLAHGVPARVGKLRAYGNAIVPQVAAEVIAAYMETRP